MLHLSLHVFMSVDPYNTINALMDQVFCMQHDYEAKRSELLEAEKTVDELRKQLEQALLAARGKREAAVAAKRKFEAARRRLDAEMATVREKVPSRLLMQLRTRLNRRPAQAGKVKTCFRTASDNPVHARAMLTGSDGWQM
jgi:thioredoxin-like negative regulator of GroEL